LLWSNRSPFRAGSRTSHRHRRGVIDQDYRGNLGVILYNLSDVQYAVYRDDRIFQLICEKNYYPTLKEVQILDVTVKEGLDQQA